MKAFSLCDDRACLKFNPKKRGPVALCHSCWLEVVDMPCPTCGAMAGGPCRAKDAAGRRGLGQEFTSERMHKARVMSAASGEPACGHPMHDTDCDCGHPPIVTS